MGYVFLCIEDDLSAVSTRITLLFFFSVELNVHCLDIDSDTVTSTKVFNSTSNGSTPTGYMF